MSAVLTHARLLEVLDYNPATGEFIRKIATAASMRIGDVAGTADPRGYRKIGIDGRCYYSHRLAWFYVHGEWPSDLIDHENLSKGDNVPRNLRPCDHSMNKANRGNPANNTSGVKGVYWHRRAQKWCAQIMVKKKNKYLGVFDSIEDAAAAYRVEAERSFGQFARAISPDRGTPQ